MGLFSQPKAMSSTSMAFPCAILFILMYMSTHPFPFGDADRTPSAYDILLENDFPVGLLPKGATGYELNRETGEFSAHLNGSCSFSLENSYQLNYNSTIEGVISKDRLKYLKGVSVKVLLPWLNIVEVVREGEELHFSVGIASGNFPVENFEECPQCGCGLDCNNFDVFHSSDVYATS